MFFPRMIAIGVGALLAGSACFPAEAMTKSQLAGYDNCRAWCYAHNKTQNSQIKCVQGCLDYWSTHVSIGPSDPGDRPTPIPPWDFTHTGNLPNSGTVGTSGGGNPGGSGGSPPHVSPPRTNINPVIKGTSSSGGGPVLQ